MRKIKELIIHCSDTDDSLDIGFRDINKWHMDRGWLSPSGISCGYHYIIRRNGEVEVGRPEEETGAHCYGHNKRSIGICLVGRKDFSPEQMLSLFAMVRGLRNKFKLEIENVHGHYEFDGNKTCPNLDMVQLRAEMIFK